MTIKKGERMNGISRDRQVFATCGSRVGVTQEARHEIP